MRVAFKEWASVVEALGSGQQIVILRKGGISEGRRGFQVEHAEFLLYPTLFHEQGELGASQRPRSQSAGEAGPEPVRLEFFAHIVSWRQLQTLAGARSLRGQHIWSDAVIEERFEWGKEQNIYAMAVRVFRLPHPLDLPVLPSYGGCKSWVDLEEDVPTDDAAPVLSKEAFNEKLNQFHAALDAEGPADSTEAAP